jgi:hypothetical protein
MQPVELSCVDAGEALQQQGERLEEKWWREEATEWRLR